MCDRIYILHYLIIYKLTIQSPFMETQKQLNRKIETHGNMMQCSISEAEEIKILVNGQEIISFVVPYDCNLKAYISREVIPIRFK